MNELDNQRIPLYRTRIIFLFIVALPMAYARLPIPSIFTEEHSSLVKRLYIFIGESQADVSLILFMASFLIAPVLFFDLIENAKLLRTDTLPRRRIVSWIVLFIEILILLALCAQIFLFFYVASIGGIMGL